MINKSKAFVKPLTLSWLLLFGLPLFAFAQTEAESALQDIQTKITYCNLTLSPGLKLGNLTFSSFYLFDVDETGKVVSVKKLRDDYVGEEPVKSCLSNWKLSGFRNGAQFSVYFYWKHGKGWVEQRISGNGFTQTMQMENVGVEKINKYSKSESITKPPVNSLKRKW